MKSLGLMDPPRARGIDQLWAKEKVRGRAGGVQARGAGYLAAPMKDFAMSKEEGLQVAAQAPPDAFSCLGKDCLCWSPSYVCCPALLHPPPDPGTLAGQLENPRCVPCAPSSSLFMTVTLGSSQRSGQSWVHSCQPPPSKHREFTPPLVLSKGCCPSCVTAPPRLCHQPRSLGQGPSLALSRMC